MADFVPPSVEDFLDRYPEFSNQDEQVIQLVLNESLALVGSSWFSDLRIMAILALTAHILYTENQIAFKNINTATGGTTTQVTGPVQSMSVGPLSVTYKAAGSVIGQSAGGGNISNMELASSPYGLRFLELLHLTEPAAILVV